MADLRTRLRFGTKLHDAVRERCLAMRNFSRDKMRDRHERWRENEEAYMIYLPEKEKDRKRRELRDAGEPQYTTLKIPFDYAVLMSAHTYLTSVFLGRSPIVQYEGRNAQGEDGVLAVEAIMDYQIRVGKHLPTHYIWLMDANKYGLGVLGKYWDEEKIVVNREEEVEDTFLGVPLGTTKKQLRPETINGYQGNRTYNVRPWDFITDPRVTIQNYQEGEFCGRHTEIGWNRVVKGAAVGRYFNIGAARMTRGTGGANRDRIAEHIRNYPFEMSEGNRFSDHAHLHGVELIELYVELIPREWQLSNSTYPEKWVFVIANEQVIIAAQPLGEYHNKYPFDLLEYEMDGYAMHKRGLLEIIGPLTDTMTWLMNTHFYNTRQALNNMFVVDPTKVVLKDLKDPSPGKIIRLKEEMYGQDVRSAIWQFPVNDVTQTHVSDTQIISQLIQRVSGVNDQVMGLLNSGGRKTATEVRTSSSFGVNRLKTIAEWFSVTGYADYAQHSLQTTQQRYDTEMKLRLAGDAFLHSGAQRHLTVSPQDIQGFYDFVPVDGTLPVDRFAQVNMWGTLMQQFAAMPQVLQQFDIARIFAWVAQLGGLKNIHRFRIQLEDPMQLAAAAQAGNVIPIGAASGPGNNAGASTGGEGNTPTPAQIPTLGPSG